MSTIDRDTVPVFTYIADCDGNCAACPRRYLPGDMVVRIGVVWGRHSWCVYHLDCYRGAKIPW